MFEQVECKAIGFVLYADRYIPFVKIARSKTFGSLWDNIRAVLRQSFNNFGTIWGQRKGNSETKLTLP